MQEDYAKIYDRMHRHKPKKFSGYSIKGEVAEIAALVKAHQACRLLDYGSGKGYQYLELRVHEAWGGVLPHCYDPGVVQLSARPDGRFDGIICTDVMEHIAKADVPEVLADIFGFAAEWAFVYFLIAFRPSSRKVLPDGRNVHLTIRPPEWWNEQFEPFARHGLTIKAEYDETEVEGGPGRG